MLDGEWRLSYGSTSVLFGTPATPVFHLTTPDVGDVDIRVADVGRPRADGRAFGVDYRAGRTITFDLGVQAATSAATRDEMETFAAAWRADSVRSVPGAVAELAMQYDGRERRVYGRPRRFAPNFSDVTVNRLGTIAADFACVDDLFYGSTQHVQTIPNVPAPQGGLLAPLGSPMLTTESSDRSMVMSVDSPLPVWPVIEIDGPIINPEVIVAGLWTLGFSLTIYENETITIDTRPWARTILRNGANVAGALTARSPRLSQASIPAGDWEVALRGVSSTGLAEASVRWRDSYSSL